MKDLHYLRPTSTPEVINYLQKYREKAKIIAGGQSLMILLRQKLLSPNFLIDISQIGNLKFIKKTAKFAKIGALTTHRTLENSPIIKADLPILANMEKQLASVHIRNLGTLGGNLCHADPSSDLAPPLIVLGAKLKLERWQGERTVLVENFFRGFLETVIQPDEILTEIQIPLLSASGNAVYIKHSARTVDTTIVGVAAFVSKAEDGDICQDIRLALGGVSSVPIRAKKAEAEMRGKPISRKTIAAAGEKAKEEASPVSDLQGSAEYKKGLIEVFVQKTIESAWEGLDKRRKEG